MKRLSMVAAVAMLAMSGSAMAAMDAGPIQEPVQIMKVSPLTERANNEFILCTGAAGNAYHNKGLDLTGGLSNVLKRPVVLHEGGGTLGCAYLLAEGKVDAMIGQGDVEVWLSAHKSPLLGAMSDGGAVLTEALLPFCARKGPSGSESDFGWIAQDDDYTIAVAGGHGSGVNIFLNAISSRDSGWREPRYLYSGSWAEGMNAVKQGQAACVIGVQDPASQAFEDLDDDFGDDLRLLETYDKDFFKIKRASGGQVYGSMMIDEDSEIAEKNLDDFMSWDGDGNPSWDVHVIALTANVYYRDDAIPMSERNAIRSVISRQANLHDADFNN